jgi:cytochrome c biogenesis protein CcmG, thiol:disulfide interchange protein DsbE
MAPPIVGTTLDGTALDLASYRGRPVIVNFWGPSCIPCRDEFPQFLHELDEHAADDLAIVGVLTDDPPEPARQFAAEYGASWPTVIDPGESIKRAYRVVARPHTWFVDRAGVLRSLQIGGPMTDAEFERHYARIR